LACINGVEDLKEWIQPTEKSVHSPYLLDNIKEVALKVIKAIEQDKNICISADCDSDGLCAFSILYRYLNHFTNNLLYTYNQREEGHGISVQVVPEETELLLICDSSTSETKACQTINERGIDICILDHHPKTKDNPYALIVNPKLCSYPNKDLSGSGVVYKLIQVIDELTSNDYSKDYIDFCGFGIYGDVMSMGVESKENRYYVYNAIKNIKNNGIKALLKLKLAFGAKVDSQTIGFTIVPIINAAARMGCIEKIIELLLEDDYDKCLVMAKEVVNIKEDRKKTEVKLYKKVKDRIDLSHNIIVVKVTEKDDINKGFNGLIATKISDKYSKPSLVVKCENGICSGSGRSINNIDFKSILEDSKLCDWVNGHASAFGVQFKEDNLENIYEAIKDKIIFHEDKIYYYDLELDEDEIDYSLIKDIEKFNLLSGKDAPDSKILVRNCNVLDRKVQGKLEDTIKIISDKMNFVKFRTNENYAEDLIPGKKFDVIGSLKINKWFNNTKGIKKWQEDLQLFIDDYRISE
jgi:single-stranded-DNA-specific exonuclease